MTSPEKTQQTQESPQAPWSGKLRTAFYLAMAVSLWMALLGALFTTTGPAEGKPIIKLLVAAAAIFTGAAGVAQTKKDIGSTSPKTLMLLALTIILTVAAVIIR